MTLRGCLLELSLAACAWRSYILPLEWCCFSCSTLGSDGSSLPSLASSQSTWRTLRKSLKSLSVEFAVLSDKAAQQVRPSVHHHHHLLCCPKLAPCNKCCFVNVLRGDGKRMMLWKNLIFSWICCSRTEWVSYSFVSLQGSPAFYDVVMFVSHSRPNDAHFMRHCKADILPIIAIESLLMEYMLIMISHNIKTFNSWSK